MLINLTNHSAFIWDKKQVDAAYLYGDIMDIPFPSLDPAATPEAIARLATTFAAECMEIISKCADEKNAVHIMGEHNFCFYAIQVLLKNGITCVASTSDRKTVEEDGLKIAVFDFVQFREYKLLS